MQPQSFDRRDLRCRPLASWADRPSTGVWQLTSEDRSMEASQQEAPNTVVLIHGLWMTARSWEKWVDRYTKRGYRVIAKSWPGMDVNIDELRRNPAPLARLDINEILTHYEHIIRGLEIPPIIMGHSFG